MAAKKLEFNPIPGFPEFMPSVDIVMAEIGDKIRKVYSMYGFSPLDTRIIEECNVLAQKGIEGKELYSINIIEGSNIESVTDTTESSKRTVALRFDLTVPLARYVAQNKFDIAFPYKRYATQKVYRAEDATVAKGRFNEFYQYDIDVIGRETLDLNYDSEFPAIIYQIFKDVIGITNFIIRISNRQLLEGLFKEYKISDVKKIKRAVKVIDDIEKVSEEITITRLQEIGLDFESATEILTLFRHVFELIPSESIIYLKSLEFKNKQLINGINELEVVINGILANGVANDNFRVDIRIARGLDYYTGTVYETILPDLPELGSVCSGGRYNDLVGTLTGDATDKFPGVGISIGFSRLIPALINSGIIKATKQTTASVLVTCQDKNCIGTYQQIGTMLRKVGIPTDVYLNKKDKLVKQLDYANKKGYQYVIIGDMKHEICNGNIVVRNMITASQETIPISELTTYLTNI